MRHGRNEASAAQVDDEGTQDTQQGNICLLRKQKCPDQYFLCFNFAAAALLEALAAQVDVLEESLLRSRGAISLLLKHESTQTCLKLSILCYFAVLFKVEIKRLHGVFKLNQIDQEAHSQNGA